MSKLLKFHAFILILVLGGFQLFDLSADAQENPSPTESPRCAEVTEQVSSLINNYTEVKDSYLLRFRTLSRDVSAFSVSVESEGYDTTQLRESLITMNDYIDQFELYMKRLLTSLNNAADAACSDDRNSFDSSMIEVNSFIIAARQQALTIRNFSLQTVKSDLIDLANSKTESNG